MLYLIIWIILNNSQMYVFFYSHLLQMNEGHLFTSIRHVFTDTCQLCLPVAHFNMAATCYLLPRLCPATA